MNKLGLDPHMVYGECPKHPGQSMIDCFSCSLEGFQKDIIRGVKIDQILKENEFHRGKDSKEGKSK
jgi:hypothetical protein